LNILIIHNYYQLRGGEDAVFELESSELEAHGHSVIRYTRHNDEIKKFNLIQKFLFFFRSIYNPQTVRDIKKIIRINKIDIAHIHNVFPLISPSVYIVLKKSGIKIVQTIHNYRFICPNGLFFDGKNICELCKGKNKIFCFLKRCYKGSAVFSLLYSITIFLNRPIFYKMIDLYIALTEFTTNKLIEFGFDPHRIVIKDNCITDNFSDYQGDGGYFLYLGRISGEKGIGFLLSSFALLPDFKLLVAGSGPLLEHYKSLYKHNTNIIFAGFVTGDKKIDIISRATATIVPSIWYENYPISLADSFSLGVPAIGSKFGGVPYLIEDKVNGVILNDLTKEDLKIAIEFVLQNRTNLSINSRITFLKNMSIENNITKLVTLYKTLLTT